MTIEAILLTGGGSTRMGLDKAEFEVQGTPLGSSIAHGLNLAGYRVTVLGRKSIEGFRFVPDAVEFAGPLHAVSQFVPEAEAVFVASCDMPHFHPDIVMLLEDLIGEEADAAVPVRAGIRQPTCALYRKRAWSAIPEVLAEGKRSLMAWLDRLNVFLLDERALSEAGLDPIHFASFNTPSELARIEEDWLRFNLAPGPPPAPEE